jgi:hypothetical protein
MKQQNNEKVNYNDCFLGFFLGMDLNPLPAIAAASNRSAEVKDTNTQHDN